MAIAQTQRFLVGTVITQTFTAFFTRILPFGGMALIGFIPTLIFLAGNFYLSVAIPGFGAFPTPGEVPDPVDPGELLNLPRTWIIASIIALFISSIATTAIWLAATCYGTFQYLRGQPVRFWQSLQRGVAVVLPCIGATFLIYLGAVIVGAIVISPMFAMVNDLEFTEAILAVILWLFLAGIVLLFIFAIIGGRLWSVIPIIAVERPGVFAALRRSWNLSRGHTWRLFGVVLVLIVALVAASFAASSVVVVLLLAVGGLSGMLIGQGLNILINMIAYSLFAIAAAVSYVELRRAKEGFGIEDIAAVFD